MSSCRTSFAPFLVQSQSFNYHIANQSPFLLLSRIMPRKDIKPKPTKVDTVDAKEQKRLQSLLPELNQLPDGWEIAIDTEDQRICFQSKNQRPTFVHPALGPLPAPYILKLVPEGGCTVPCYKNVNDPKDNSAKDPRQRADVIKAQEAALRKRHASNKPGIKSAVLVSAAIRQLRKGQDLQDLNRSEIEQVDISDKYEYLHAIDTGQIGGMNNGVFVVRLKGSNNLRVEKRFKTTRKADYELAVREIQLQRRVKHSALTFYIAAYITPTDCALWMEFCDRGSLTGIMKQYKKHREETPPDQDKPRMPEKFLWHCFIGLNDALTYLRTGLSFNSGDIRDPNKKAPGWIPILHRDIKPDNILLRSRATSGDRKYFYVTLSDFGLACEDYPKGHPKEDPYQHGGMLGTGYWLAPELCWDPYPKTPTEHMTFPNGFMHSEKTDLWALGTIIHNLAECDQFAHIVPQRQKEVPPNAQGTSRYIQKHPKDIKIYYSQQIRTSILEATAKNPRNRPTPAEMMVRLRQRVKDFYGDNSQPTNPEDQLAQWATRIHDYHSRTPQRPEDFMKNK